MTALEYMENQVVKHRLNYDREFTREVPEEMLQNIRNKISYYEAAVEALRNPVVHGRWYWAEDGHCKCSVCGQYATVKRTVVKTNYCPNCGARMKDGG
jgi:hypothetical protein